MTNNAFCSIKINCAPLLVFLSAWLPGQQAIPCPLNLAIISSCKIRKSILIEKKYYFPPFHYVVHKDVMYIYLFSLSTCTTPPTPCDHARMGFGGSMFSVSVDNMCDLFLLKASVLLYFWQECAFDPWELWMWNERWGCARLLSILVWSCSLLHSYLYIVRAGSGPGKGSCAAGLSTPGSWLSYFFKIAVFSCSMINNGRRWNVRMSTFWETYGLVSFFWLLFFPHNPGAFLFVF